MNLSLPPHRRQRLLINLLDQQRLWHSAVNCVWASSCFYFSYGCSAKWEEVGPDTTLPIQVLGAGVPGEVDLEAFPPAASPGVEAEAFRVHECEVEAEVVAQDALINT
jgi:hypothetical protein